MITPPMINDELPELADDNRDNEKYKNSYDGNRYYLICSHPKGYRLAQ
jgi:hypothetical protein